MEKRQQGGHTNQSLVSANKPPALDVTAPAALSRAAGGAAACWLQRLRRPGERGALSPQVTAPAGPGDGHFSGPL